MNIRDLIPKDKGDTATVEKLKNYSIDEVRPIIPDLLEWLQDMNWPVAGPVADYLETIKEHLTEDILKILKGDDDIWKYWTLRVFYIGAKPSDKETISVLTRIASQPTFGERENEIDSLAKEILAQ